MIGRLPVDYFVWPEKRFVFDRKRSSTWLFLAKNLYGVAFVLIGVALLILPGPGPVTILLGIALLDLPRKHRLVVHFASKSPLQRTLQWLRRRTGGDPFKFPPR